MKRFRIGRRAAGALAAALMCFGVTTAAWATNPVDQTQQEAFVPQVQAAINSCLINSDKSTITIKATASGDMTGTDGVIYLVELQPYQSNLEGRTDYAGSAALSDSLSFTLPLNHNTAEDKLYSKFVLAVWDGTKYIEISNHQYVTNPELIAKNTQAFVDPLTKKGLNIELNMLADAFDLGVKHVAVNIAFHQILGQGIDYQFEGKTYHFDKNIIAGYDKTISAFSGKGMTVTAIILNGWNDNTPNLIYPGTKKSSTAFYYLFNTATKEGFDETRAIASFLAERYDGSNGYQGKISNWIIGNEINNQQWNYTGAWDIDSYVQAYQNAFRVFYTAIKSTSASDRVYFSLDYNWNTDYDNKVKYTGKGIVDTFNRICKEQGQMEWGLSYHPYPAPMTEPEFWDDENTGLITYDYNSPVINFQNLSILTDYMAQDSLKTAGGQVRPIILTEQGFTGTSLTRGDVSQIQAAAYAYSYYLVDSNPHIDAYILSRQVDAPVEVRSGLSFGLWECSMNNGENIVATKRRKIWQVFRDIDKKNYTLEATEFAKPIIGIQNWSDVVPNFKWSRFEKK
jgi:hypothetical protein